MHIFKNKHLFTFFQPRPNASCANLNARRFSTKPDQTTLATDLPAPTGTPNKTKQILDNANDFNGISKESELNTPLIKSKSDNKIPKSLSNHSETERENVKNSDQSQKSSCAQNLAPTQSKTATKLDCNGTTSPINAIESQLGDIVQFNKEHKSNWL